MDANDDETTRRRDGGTTHAKKMPTLEAVCVEGKSTIGLDGIDELGPDGAWIVVMSVQAGRILKGVVSILRSSTDLSQ